MAIHTPGPDPRLSGLDTVFLAAERPGAALHTMAVLVLDPTTVPGGYDFERFRDTVARRAAHVPPLCRRLVGSPIPGLRSRWQTVDALDIERHVFHAALGPPGDARRLAEFAASVDERPLDRHQPLWEMHVTEGLADGSIAVICKLSHALMDGVAGMEFMGSFFTTEPDTEDDDTPTNVDGRRADDLASLARRTAIDLAALPVRVARAVGEVTFGAARAALTVARHGSDGVRSGAPRVAWNGALSEQRSAAFAELALDDVRDVARCHDARVNDVVLAVLAGALRDRLLHDDALPDRPLVAAVPVSVHVAGSAAANAVSVILVPVATNLDDPLERLASIHAATERAKATHRAIGPRLLMTVTELVPPPVVQLGAMLLVDVVGPQRLPPICNFMCSNVAGPPMPLYFAGARLRALYPLGPVFPGMGLNVTAVSCEHNLGIGLVTCPEVLPDLWSIAEALPKYLDDLKSTA